MHSFRIVFVVYAFMICIFCVFNTSIFLFALIIPLVATSGEVNYLSLVVWLLFKCLLMPFFWAVKWSGSAWCPLLSGLYCMFWYDYVIDNKPPPHVAHLLLKKWINRWGKKSIFLFFWCFIKTFCCLKGQRWKKASLVSTKSRITKPPTPLSGHLMLKVVLKFRTLNANREISTPKNVWLDLQLKIILWWFT